MNQTRLRAWWWRRQGLDGALAGAAPAAILARTGWARSVGGVNPYLTLFARGGVSRAHAEQAHLRLEIHELPAARGCTYVLPAADFALGLAAGGAGDADLKQALKLGVTGKEIAKLCDGVLRALEAGPLDPEGIREATGKLSRSLGEEGKKKGLTTTLPLALGELQRTGRIRRVPVDGRLDQQRYRYALWTPNPLAGFSMTAEQVHRELAKRFLEWAGPAALDEFRWFSGLGVKAAQAALAGLATEAVDNRLLLAADREAFEKYREPKDPRYALVSSLDGITLLRRDLAGLLDPADAAREVIEDKALAKLGGLGDPPSHTILDRGRIVGLWEFDPERAEIAWTAFVKRNDVLKAAVARTEEFIRSLGDARSFSLDSSKSRAPQIAKLRAMG